jgi:two-component system chemotaxis response regulator CheB
VAALTAVLTTFPPNCPPTVVVQHMPAGFTASFAARLNQTCRNEVLEARDGDDARPGRILIAPGGRHMTLRRAAANRYTVQLTDTVPVCHQRPSVDVLFHSLVAAGAAPRCRAALLTGMGTDGANGLLALRRNGARTVAQNEATCTVFGMPAAAIALGAADRVVPLDRVAQTLLDWPAESRQKEVA